jgi:phosphocarrier protein
MSSEKTETGKTITRNVTVINKPGMHARPSANLARTATRFKCDIYIEKDGETVNAKSIMGLMMLAAGPGTKLTILATGPDAKEALDAIEELAKRKFDVSED